MHRIFATPFASIYALYVAKAERKQRTQADVDRIICWLTGHTPASLQKHLKTGTPCGEFLEKAPAYNPQHTLITGVVCGIRVEDVADPLMKRVRELDKLIDELAKGKTLDKILRAPPHATHAPSRTGNPA